LTLSLTGPAPGRGGETGAFGTSGAPRQNRVARGDDDAELLGRAASGDQAALGELYDRYAGVVYSLCLRILRSRDDADEVLVDVFAELWARSGRYDPSRGTVIGYLLTLARSRAIDRHRRRGVRREEPLETLLMPAAAGDAPQEHAALSEEREAVRRSLARLDENERLAIEYSYWDDMSHSAIAAKLNKPLGTVKTWIRQGLNRLRQAMGERQ
jgi:RNA polymerase sigma-70 factor (ECF subfamily)